MADKNAPADALKPVNMPREEHPLGKSVRRYIDGVLNRIINKALQPEPVNQGLPPLKQFPEPIRLPSDLWVDTKMNDVSAPTGIPTVSGPRQLG